jgi:chemotaxis protein CheD
MEMLINDILKQGGRREQLEVKLVGGGRVLDAMTDIGARNIEFVRDMKQEGFRVLGEDLGGEHPRKVMFHPQSGNARVKKLTRTKPAEIAERERKYSKRIDSAPTSGDVELF